MFKIFGKDKESGDLYLKLYMSDDLSCHPDCMNRIILSICDEDGYRFEDGILLAIDNKSGKLLLAEDIDKEFGLVLDDEGILIPHDNDGDEIEKSTIAELKKENEKLNYEVESQHLYIQCYEGEMCILNSENKKLKENNNPIHFKENVYMKLEKDKDGDISLMACNKDGEKLYDGHLLWLLKEGIFKTAWNINKNIGIKLNVHNEITLQQDNRIIENLNSENKKLKKEFEEFRLSITKIIEENVRLKAIADQTFDAREILFKSEIHDLKEENKRLRKYIEINEKYPDSNFSMNVDPMSLFNEYKKLKEKQDKFKEYIIRANECLENSGGFFGFFSRQELVQILMDLKEMVLK